MMGCVRGVSTAVYRHDQTPFHRENTPVTDERRHDWGAAVHEAGHVVVALLYGLQVKDVWIDDFGGGGGSSIQDPKEKALSASQQVILCLAGGVAQKNF